MKTFKRQESNEIACGIDFGTSNTTVAIAQGNDDPITLVPVEDEHLTIPSTIFFPTESPTVVFGRKAITAHIAREDGRFMRSFKRVLGTSLMKEGTYISGRKTNFENIIGHFIEDIKLKAELSADREINNVVAGRPVHFVDGNDKADKEAEAQLNAIFAAAGFKNIRFQYEPIAAAFAHELTMGDTERLAVVMDIGGGTSDFTVMRLSERYIKKHDRQEDILSNAGIRMGGNDFDRALSMKCFMPLLGLGSLWGCKGLGFPITPFFDLSELSKIQSMYTQKYKRDLSQLIGQSNDKVLTNRLLSIVEEEQGHTLMSIVEEAKIRLSACEQTTADLSFIEADLQVRLDRAKFEDSLHGCIESIQKTINACIVMAGIKTDEVALVILTGGGTAIPLIQQITRRIFPHAEISDGNRLSSVGFGLACDARRYYLGAN
ncbi:Hsp70 family protein [Methylobacter tundripaludum]|uniref:Hsp70 family protein n=1 Tax=Methylobacter tundripaludum TaxID=173365 RepID=UPI00055E6D06|nr:Hsp70 family protein [Methylobacter tundripaludum]